KIVITGWIGAWRVAPPSPNVWIRIVRKCPVITGNERVGTSVVLTVPVKTIAVGAATAVGVHRPAGANHYRHRTLPVGDGNGDDARSNGCQGRFAEQFFQSIHNFSSFPAPTRCGVIAVADPREPAICPFVPPRNLMVVLVLPEKSILSIEHFLAGTIREAYLRTPSVIPRRRELSRAVRSAGFGLGDVQRGVIGEEAQAGE